MRMAGGSGKRAHTSASEAFQNIKDRYPYSKFAVAAEIKIADTLYKRELLMRPLMHMMSLKDSIPSIRAYPMSSTRRACAILPR